jgi:PAS domain S-box-containing protein
MSTAPLPPAHAAGLDPFNADLARDSCVRVTAMLLALTVPLLGIWIIFRPFRELSVPFAIALHGVLEIVTVIVAAMIVVVASGGAGPSRNRNMTLLGAIGVGVAGFDLLHIAGVLGLLHDDGLPGADPSIGFWLAGRLLMAAGLLAVAYRSWDRMVPAAALGRWSAVTVAGLCVTAWLLWPDPGIPARQGAFAAAAAFVTGATIVVISMAAALGFYRLAMQPSRGSAGTRYEPIMLMVASVVLGLASLLVMIEPRVDGPLHTLAHAHKLVAAAFLFRGLVTVNLAEVETLSRLALEAADFGAWSWDLKTDTVELDANAARIWGLPRQPPLASGVFDALVHPADRQARRAAMRQSLDPSSGRGSYRAEFRLTRAGSGLRTIVDLGHTAFRDGKPVRVLGISRDITEERDAEHAARSMEARLSSVLSIAADAIISVDEQGRIVLFNNGAETIFGYSAAEVLGRPLEMLLPERYRKGHAGHMRRFAEAPTVARRMGERSEIFALAKGGREFPAEASISKLELDGAMTYTVVLRDITARKQVEKALAAANEDLEKQVAERTRELHAEMQRREEAQSALAKAQRMEAFGQLAGGIAHDFNNLLTVITGNQELLEMRLEDPRQRTLLKRAQEAAEMGARLTARLLTFARRRRLEPTLLDLNEQIIGMVELLRRSIGETVTLTTNLAPGLGLVTADPSEIENAVLNLAINARDAMPNGGALVIETSNVMIDDGTVGEVKLPAGSYVRLAVSDTGTGMTQEVLQRAFEPFFTTKQPGKGTGLGLSTIYGFVQQSGGTVTAYSEVGRGTTINIYLPRAASDSAPVEPRPDVATLPMGTGATVLVVEDNAGVREVARQRLMDLGYKVIEAETGVRAIEILGSPPADLRLVFSDVVMPGGMSGFDVARWVAANRPDIRVVLASGYPDEIAVAQEGKLPIVKLLRKPYNRADLAWAMHHALTD